MPNKDQPNKGKTASGDSQAESREAHSDRLFPQRRGTGQFGTHGGPSKQEPPSPAANEPEEPNRE